MNSREARHAMAEVSPEVRSFVDAVPGARRRADAETLLEMFGRITGQSPTLWSATIVGFGSYHYKYATGREGDAAAAAFAPRKAATSIYLADGIGAHTDALSRLGEHTVGVGCLYIKDLGKVDLAVLEEIVTTSYATLSTGTYPFRAAESAPGTDDAER
ncbi:uncharacterized protein DUF1801 [Glaciihabitans tibetensis]|uniref:Uncharacterized protein DUF1801 n=1 Tax=Glaciihabitans tibetensis TaxID=1266600 RepID=A0A2T0VAF0_9MICO|nr:DUF1801 domain-containing protein [Glaciihabitans tibetensis]PRY67133.1 uncharacterized protein DUF1801 [Glaciihabitans tibetensis]